MEISTTTFGNIYHVGYRHNELVYTQLLDNNFINPNTIVYDTHIWFCHDNGLYKSSDKLPLSNTKAFITANKPFVTLGHNVLKMYIIKYMMVCVCQECIYIVDIYNHSIFKLHLKNISHIYNFRDSVFLATDNTNFFLVKQYADNVFDYSTLHLDIYKTLPYLEKSTIKHMSFYNKFIYILYQSGKLIKIYCDNQSDTKIIQDINLLRNVQFFEDICISPVSGVFGTKFSTLLVIINGILHFLCKQSGTYKPLYHTISIIKNANTTIVNAIDIYFYKIHNRYLIDTNNNIYRIANNVYLDTYVQQLDICALPMQNNEKIVFVKNSLMKKSIKN